MPTNTYVALDKVTVGTATTSIVFSSIPATYTDLVIVCSVNYNSTGNNILMGYNGDTGSNYSSTILAGNGSSAVSARFSNSSTGWILDYYGGTANEYFTKVISIMSYSNTTTFKTGICRSSSASKEAVATVGLWRNTAAINQITLSAGGANFNVGSTFSLYGIAAQVTPGTAKATGGTITYDNFGRVIHTFTSSGTFTPNQALTCDYLVVAGGGSGGKWIGAGGGAGGVRSTVTTTGGGGSLETALSLAATAYTVTIGAGGASQTTSSTAGNNGSSSTFSTVTSTGGGGGGAYSNIAGVTGGSGGGGGHQAVGGSGTANQGFAGGSAVTAANFQSAGGGGAGAVGASSTGSGPGAGGSGIATSITGSSVSYGGGGGGTANAANGAAGGSGGGGAGSLISGDGVAGTANTGGGGGGNGNGQPSNISGAGGSGVVIIRYQG